MQEMSLAFIGMTPKSGEQFMVLRETDGSRALVLGIGFAEATSVAMGAGRIRAQRPLTHDLIIDLLQRLEVSVRRVVIHDLQNNAFIAVLDLDTPKGVQEIDCRPSDGVALAVRMKSPIFAAEGLLERAGVDLDELPSLRDLEADDDEHDDEWID